MMMQEMVDTDLSDLLEMQKKLKSEEFYGTLLTKWQAGRVVLVETTQTCKPKDFGSLVIRIGI